MPDVPFLFALFTNYKKKSVAERVLASAPSSPKNTKSKFTR